MRKKVLVLALFFLWAVPVFAESVDTAWVRRYDYSSGIDIATALAVDGSGNVYVTGYVTPSGQLPDYATIKYYANGTIAWVKTYNGTANNEDKAQAIATQTSGRVYVTGWGVNAGTSYDYVTIKYGTATGDTAWVRKYNNPTVNLNDEATAMAVDGSGNVYVTGSSNGDSTNRDYATVKYDALGNEIWVRRYNGPANGNDYATAIAVDDFGNVYVTGNSYVSAANDDYVTIKYYPNGDTAWVRRYNGPGDSTDYARAIGVDGSGNVYVTGTSLSATSYDYATIKYYSNGSLAWVQRYDGPGHDVDDALAMSVDGPGNAYVTGYSWGGSVTAEDIATIKYKPNGDTAWIRRYNGPDNKSDGGQAITIDGAGNVYVAGWSRGNLTDFDYITLKYDMNGYLRWTATYNGEKDSTDIASDIAVDSSGNVYVTGYSVGSLTGPDYTTIKYFQIVQRTDTLYFKAFSPVNLIVTDPVKDSIGVDFNTILKGSFYDTTMDLNNDGDKDDRVVIPNPIMRQYMVRVVPEPGGSGNYTLAVKLDGNEDRVMVANAPAPGPGQVDTVVYNVPKYLHGDANRDGKKTVSDVVFLINYLFKGGPAPVPVDLGDVNFCEQNPPIQPGQPTVADVIYLVNYLFKGGKAPCS
jgi:hypothetical protein